MDHFLQCAPSCGNSFNIHMMNFTRCGKIIKNLSRILSLHLSMLIRRPEILSIEINKNHKLEIKHEFDYFDFIIVENGNQIPLINYVNDFRQEVNLNNKQFEKMTKHYKTPKAVITNRRTNTSVTLDEFSITGQLIEFHASRKIQFTLIDKVWLIIKSIFEERVFTFSENGLINEYKK